MSPAIARPVAPDDSDERFLAEVRAFLAKELTEDLREAGRQTTGVHTEIAAARAWHTRLYRRGWVAPGWPRAHGGCGWSVRRRFLFEQECARNDAPIIFGTGIRSIGPLIIVAGTPEQKSRFLEPILSGEDLWCQGFSEPGAGSDLAGLSTRAEVNGDSYVVTGRKIWTTGAHLANRMFALVRTGRGEKQQEGITFLLIDMASAGISVRPVITIDGEHEFNEVVFEGVRVPIANRVGAENQGWTMAKQLMRFARSNNTTSGSLRRAWRLLEREVARCQPGPDFALRMAETGIALTAMEALELRLLAAGRLDGEDDTASSLMKTSATELHQKIAELAFEACGPLAQGLECGPNGTMQPSLATRKYFATRAATIYSGTSEIHRNIMARQLSR
ncbi:MAG: acyl-CoA dehydrogenase family protein [Alphaproteobacteria bacterium]|nr:acyl-CoA dehydrogenase family protein [Alphaproteobacteria bacterium]